MSTGLNTLNPSSAAGVSVVIPAFNYAKFLPNAVESVLRQTFRNFELIVVDDGSTDNTRAVMEQYHDERIRYVYQENSGLSAARNTGIRSSRFDYIAFLDADDEWMPDMLEVVMNAFAALPAEYGMVAGGCVSMDYDGNRSEGRNLRIETDREFVAGDFIMRNPAPLSSSVVIKSCVFRDCGVFDTALRSSEDRDMWIRIAVSYRVLFICKPVVSIRKHRHSMSAHATRMRKNTLKTIGKAYRNRVVSRFNVPFWLRVLGVYYFETAWTHYDEQRRWEAFLFMIASFAAWPFPLNAAALFEPPFFRIRAAICYLTNGAHARLKPILRIP